MPRVPKNATLPSFIGFTISQGSFHLRLIEELGNGAHGVIYVAKDLSPHPRGPRYYAVKCLPKYERGSVLHYQLYREITNHDTMSDHPNVVTLHEVIEEEFYIFLVLDLCQGGDLFNAIMDRGTFEGNDKAVRRTFLQLIDAVEACHAKRVYHRDIKPENILCSKDDRSVYLADFGLSTKNRHSTSFGCGSSFYMSPECYGPSRKATSYATGPSDVWALGTILCNMLTGRNPWRAASPKADPGFHIYLQRGAPFLREQLGVSAQASEVLARIFTVDPRARITLPELRAAVRAVDSFFPAVSPGPSTGRPLAAIVEEPEPELEYETRYRRSTRSGWSVSGSSSASDSSGPATPASAAFDPAGAVPPLALDGAFSSSEYDAATATGPKMEKKPTRSLARLFLGMRTMGMRP
ncbi:kinase-like domain-containing protein [Trametes meyenii]|nr:kinase-like domain-containing protein [Trametes meyenii]